MSRDITGVEPRGFETPDLLHAMAGMALALPAETALSWASTTSLLSVRDHP
jgi:hypothetical protein